MTGAQLYLAIGVPGVLVLIGMLVNAMHYGSLNARMSSLEGRMTNLENKFDTRFDLLLSKVVDIDNRLIRLEAQRH